MTEIMDEYYKMREYLGINVLDITGSFQTVPRILDAAGELYARANKNLAMAKYNIQIAEANAAANIRLTPMNGKAPSVAAIETMVPLDPEVQEAVKVWANALYEANACEGLHEALKGQWIMMHKVSDLTMTGYFNPGALPPERPNREANIRAREELYNRDRSHETPEPTRRFRPNRADQIRANFRRKEDQ